MARAFSGNRNGPSGSDPDRGSSKVSRNRISRLFRLSVRGTLTLLLLVVIVPSLLVEALHYYNLFEERRSSQFAVNLELARAIGEGFEDYIRSVLGQELTIGATLASGQPLRDEQIIRLLTVSAREHPSIRHYVWISPQGRIIASS